MRLATSIIEGNFVEEADPLPPDDLRSASAPRVPSVERLYRSHASRLLRFFSRRAGSADAPDLVHEAFVRFASCTSRSGEPIERPEAYLSTVATNVLRDRARLAARRALQQQGPAFPFAETSTDPHQLLEDRDMLARLEVAVARLSSRRRRIFLLHRLERLTYAEIAVEVGMSVKGVKTQMAKALYELRRDMGPL